MAWAASGAKRKTRGAGKRRLWRVRRSDHEDHVRLRPRVVAENETWEIEGRTDDDIDAVALDKAPGFGERRRLGQVIAAKRQLDRPSGDPRPFDAALRLPVAWLSAALEERQLGAAKGCIAERREQALAVGDDADADRLLAAAARHEGSDDEPESPRPAGERSAHRSPPR
jgi:hypothetical protein